MKKRILNAIFIVFLLVGTAYSLTYQIKTQAIVINATATKLPTTPLVGREYILVTNTDTVTVYIGDSNVNTTIGTPLFVNQRYYAEYDNTVDVYGIITTGNATVIVEEGK